ncbi:MAG: hypothetical protein DRJ40_08670 [Thermoprotei archaeon]|nr:MAG: hypothetical protein DRJ40_08670 [Thermoprotei archaeon]
MHVETAKWFREVYLSHRERYIGIVREQVEKLGTDIEEWSSKLIPFPRRTLREEIYRASELALGRRIELYDLRKFFATHMALRGAPGQVVDILQGRTPPKEFEVLMRHYVTIGQGTWIQDLRNWYNKSASKILH